MKRRFDTTFSKPTKMVGDMDNKQLWLLKEIDLSEFRMCERTFTRGVKYGDSNCCVGPCISYCYNVSITIK